MENLLDSWGLTVITFSPLLGALVMFLLPKEKEQEHKVIALVPLFGLHLWV